MLGLASYQSSSEDEMESNDIPQPKPAERERADNTLQTADEPNDRPERPADVEPSGPVLGPSGHHELDAMNEPSNASDPSHFSAIRTSIHDLTLPPVANLDIPPSPPGSPDPGANAKFAHFLSLKKQGVHFNEKLAGSTSLKNPSLLAKLRDHVGIDDQAQYSSTLPSDIWDASTLPDWGYKEELWRTQQETRRKAEEKRAMGQRDSIEFTHSASSSGISRPG